MNKVALLLFLIVLISNCDESQENPGVPVLTVEVGNNLFPRNHLKWIYISDANGKKLDGQMLRVGTFTLNAATVPPTVDVTIYTIIEQGGTRLHNLVTVLQVPTGKTLRFKRMQLLSFPPIGSVNFAITNWNYTDYAAGNLYITPSFAVGAMTPDQASFDTDKMMGTFRVFSPDSKVLFTAIRNQARVYRWASNVKPNDNLNLDIASFAPFQYSVEIPETYVSAYAWGYLGQSKYHLGTSRYDPFSGKTTLGYIEGFDYYYTEASSAYYQQQVTYIKSGSRPTSITLPDFYGVVSRRLITSFEYISPVTFDHYSANFSWMSKPVTWQVNGPTNKSSIRFIPDELRQSFPDVDPDDLNFNFLEVKKRLDGYGYNEFVDEYFNAGEPQKYFEYYRITAFN